MSTHCLYASKPCMNPRSLKDNGDLHRLCMFHRVKANDAQRRWHERQRRTRTTGSTKVSDIPTDSDASGPSSKALQRTTSKRQPTKQASHAKSTKKVTAKSLHRRGAIAQPRGMLTLRAKLPTNLTLLPSTPPTIQAIHDDEFGMLDEFLVELEETKLFTTFSGTEDSTDMAFEKEWWLTNHHSTETTVYCL